MRGWLGAKWGIFCRHPWNAFMILFGSVAGFIRALLDIPVLFKYYDLLLARLICAFVLILLASCLALSLVVGTLQRRGGSLKGIARALVGFFLSFVLGILVSYAWGGFVRSQGSSVRITLPKQGQSVVHQQLVTGTVLNPTTDVWVVVHPMATPGFFVQPRVGVRSDRTWSVYAFFGSGPSTDAAQEFEVGAFANPKVRLAVGQVLSDWPEAESRDIVGVVTR
ncbi:MAG TPA: hypothetical protein VM537_33130 [Anaerolineae bacterium]|nr:hypothetical protein [Anaerolineae bacterium]